MTIFTEKGGWIQGGFDGPKAYKDDVIDGLMLTASAPIYDREGVFPRH